MEITLNSGYLGTQINDLIECLSEEEKADILRDILDKVPDIFFRRLKQKLYEQHIISLDTLNKIGLKPLNYR